MKVYIHCFLEFPTELTEAASNDPDHVRVSPTRDGNPRTFVQLIEAEDEYGRQCLIVPNSVRVPITQEHWRVSIHAVGDEVVQVRRNGLLIRPFAAVTTQGGRQLRKYSGSPGEMTIVFARDDAGLIHMQPVVMQNRRRGDFFIDPRIRRLGPAKDLQVFITECTETDPEENDLGTMDDYRAHQSKEKEALVS